MDPLRIKSVPEHLDGGSYRGSWLQHLLSCRCSIRICSEYTRLGRTLSDGLTRGATPGDGLSKPEI